MISFIGDCSLLLMAMTVVNIVHSYKSDRTYPHYCSTPSQHVKIKIPPLDRNSEVIGHENSLQLKHVTGVIRHGARTPYARHTCWPSYLEKGEETAEWDCSLSSLSAPPSRKAIELLKDKDLDHGESVQSPEDLADITFSSGETPSFMFEKRYDATFSPSHSDHYPDNLGNHLQGTCQIGQLTLRGYEQERSNGIFFREAYVKSTDADINTDRNEKELLYNFDDEINNDAEGSRAYDDPALYFRSDDDQRTMMSGQALLNELFGDLMLSHANKNFNSNKHNAVIRVHTSDRDRDYLSPNDEICPILKELEEESRTSDAWKTKYEESDLARTMMDFADEYLGGWWRYENPGVAIDCFMTTACSDRPLPFALDVDASGDNKNIQDRFGQNIIDRWTQFHTERASWKFRYNNFKYSQIVTNPLWNDIMGGLLAFTNADKHEMSKAWPDLRPPSKLALYSGHDDTIMALLSSLGPGVWDGTVWPAYASMFLIELYEINFDHVLEDKRWELEEEFPTRTVFRLIYNGEVLTHKVSGCPPEEEVCDLDILIIHVFRFSNVTEWGHTCQAKPPQVGGNKTKEREWGDNDQRHGDRVAESIFAMFGSAIVFGSAGAFLMFIYLTREQIKENEEHSLGLQPETSSSIELPQTRSNNYSLAAQSDAMIT